MGLNLSKAPLILAVVGKGGSGKSVIATLIAKTLIRNYHYNLLLIDGDPAYPHFSKMMNVTPTRNLETIKSQLLRSIQSGDKTSTQAAKFIDFEVYGALIETKEFSLISIGQPEESGCFCPSNTIMKKVIESISKDFDIVIIDCEAGLEQINRMVLESVDIVIIISDETQRSIETAVSIKSTADKFTNYHKIGLIINRVKGNTEKLQHQIKHLGLELFALIPEDENIKEYDNYGKAIIDIPENTSSYQTIKKALSSILEDLDSK